MAAGMYCAIMGGGDFMNMFNAAVQTLMKVSPSFPEYTPTGSYPKRIH